MELTLCQWHRCERVYAPLPPSGWRHHWWYDMDVLFVQIDVALRSGRPPHFTHQRFSNKPARGRAPSPTLTTLTHIRAVPCPAAGLTRPTDIHAMLFKCWAATAQHLNNIAWYMALVYPSLQRSRSFFSDEPYTAKNQFYAFSSRLGHTVIITP